MAPNYRAVIERFQTAQAVLTEETIKEIRSDEKNLPLYHLAFFSKHERGYEFWEQVQKYSTDQRGLFD